MRTALSFALLICAFQLLQAPSNSQHIHAHVERQLRVAVPASSSSGSSSLVVPSAHMGVHHCRLLVNGSAFGSQLGYNSTFALHVFLRYTTFNATTKVKGFASVQTLEALPSGRKDVILDPRVQLVPVSGAGGSASGRGAGAASLQLRGTMQFPFVSRYVVPRTPRQTQCILCIKLRSDGLLAQPQTCTKAKHQVVCRLEYIAVA